MKYSVIWSTDVFCSLEIIQEVKIPYLEPKGRVWVLANILRSDVKVT